MEVLGKTMDDAAGEAFDKSAKILGLSYPGGPLIDKFSKGGNPNAFQFGIGKVLGLAFSFSGFKTSVLYLVRDKMEEEATFIQNNMSDICASIQFTIVNYLLSKLKKAAKHTGIKHIALAGGVSANSELRDKFERLAVEEKWKSYIPAFEYCTDNAAMIACAGYYKMLRGEISPMNVLSFASIKV